MSRKNYDLLGKVKTIKETRHNAIDTNNTIILYKQDSSNYTNFTRTFDKKGNEVTVFYFDINGNLFEKRTFLYNPKNNLIEQKDFDVKNDTLSDVWIFLYNRKGKLIERSNHDKKYVYSYYNNGGKKEEKLFFNKKKFFTWKYVHVFNASRKLIEKAKYYNSGVGSDTNRLVDKTLYSYNSKGKKIEESVFLGKNVNQMPEGSLWERDTFAYDKNGYEIGFLHYNEKQKITQKVTSVRDSKGNPVELYFYDEKGDITYKEISTYKYDRQGNWIEKTCNNNGQYYITIREIEYY